MNAGQLREAYTDVTAENAGQTLYTRCERETLMRFPETKAILFTIRTYVRPLAWYAARPTECATLAEALRQLPEDMVRPFTLNSVFAVPCFVMATVCHHCQTDRQLVHTLGLVTRLHRYARGQLMIQRSKAEFTLLLQVEKGCSVHCWCECRLFTNLEYCATLNNILRQTDGTGAA